MVKITGFAFINAMEVKTISYTYNEYDDDLNLLKANIRKSMTVKETDTCVLQCIQEVFNHLLAHEGEIVPQTVCHVPEDPSQMPADGTSTTT